MRNGIKKCAMGVLITATLFAKAYAVSPGFYFGLMFGPATNNASSQVVNTTPPPTNPPVLANPRSTQFGTRFFMGNKLNRWAAFEGGVTLYTGISYKPTNATGSPTSTARVRTFDIDIKGTIPFANTFEAFAKGGVAVVYLSTSGGLNANDKSTYNTSYRPILGIGMNYTINQNWVGEVSATRTLVGSFIHNVDLYAIGFSYHFVDIYCGQFLCDDE